MSDREVTQRLQSVFNKVTGRNDVILSPGLRLNSISNINSFVLIQLVCAVENEFDIEISNNSIRSLKTTDDVVRVIKKALKDGKD